MRVYNNNKYSYNIVGINLYIYIMTNIIYIICVCNEHSVTDIDKGDYKFLSAMISIVRYYFSLKFKIKKPRLVILYKFMRSLTFHILYYTRVKFMIRVYIANIICTIMIPIYKYTPYYITYSNCIL